MIGVSWLGSRGFPMFFTILWGEPRPTLPLVSGCRFRKFYFGVVGGVFECRNFLLARMFDSRGRIGGAFHPPQGSVCGGFACAGRVGYYFTCFWPGRLLSSGGSDAECRSKKRRHSYSGLQVYRGGLFVTSGEGTVPDGTAPPGVCSCGREAAHPGEGGDVPGTTAIPNLQHRITHSQTWTDD